MTKTSGQKTRVRGRMLAALESDLADAAEDLGQSLLDMKLQEAGGLADFKDKMARLRDLISGFNQERARLDKLLGQDGNGPGGGEGQIDLAAARAAVERGLARLAAARDAEPVPE